MIPDHLVEEPLDLAPNLAKGRMETNLNGFVTARNVFSKGWINQKLTIRERALIFDFPVNRIEMMKEEKIRNLLETAGLVAGKVLHGVLGFLNAEVGPCPAPAIEEIEEDKEMGFELGCKLSQLQLRRKDKIHPKSIEEIEFDPAGLFEEGLDDIAEKAVKTDNSEVSVALWNGRIRLKLMNMP